MKKISCLALLAFVLLCCDKKAPTNVPAPEPEVRREFGIAVDSFRIDTFAIKRNETVGSIFQKLGATVAQRQVLTQQCQQQTEFAKIIPGKPYYALYRGDTLQYYIYQPNLQEAFIIKLLEDSVAFEYHQKNIRTAMRTAHGVIEASLWHTIIENELPIELMLALSDIYAWTIDFFALQKGNKFIAYYEEKYVDTTLIGIGKVYAANFFYNNQWSEAYYYEDDYFHSYYDANGVSLRKAFLKAPLNYRRISSRFSYSRVHPIFKVRRPHLGVDYAAPVGTPVVTIGDGVVIEKKYDKGGGYMLKIKHNSTYTTGYLHLQSYAKGINVGSHVRQGDVIGYVGSTGHSTGPHLDFRVWKNKQNIDPLKMEAPPVEPIPESVKPRFDSTVNALKPFIIPDEP